ncbi:multiple epidermal growth factor-like domains protein 10 isoform X2 [Littorina saxatilis]|uniref:Kringle domain-containing protein n=1 Tax=Littorina saxatilis TaxID=31220 RepID=A0AAN9BAL5_9CAEN
MANDQHFGKICIITLSLLLFGVTSNCPPGKFGWKCNVECKCKTDTSLRCNEATGKCKEGCDNDSYGPHCLFEKSCMYDEVGEMYTGTVNMTEKGIPCRQWDYINDNAKFLKGDNPQNFCRNPGLGLSGAYAFKPWCYVDRSQNDTTGSDFEYCELQKCSCPKYLFGTGCTKQCHCNMTDEVCDAMNGRCKSGCAPGWVGSGCQKKCDIGKYGSGCSQTCEKCDRDDCDPETGVCRSGCVKGYSGLYCNKNCPPGKFGWKCNVECKCKTDTSLRCNEATGKCKEGCDNDSYGPHCLFDKSCMYDVAGESYTGTVNVTAEGIPCRQWDYINDNAKFLQGDNPQNFCRNPELSGAYASKPWCFVDRSQNDTTGSNFGYCELQKCSCPKYLFGTGCTKQCHCNMTDEVCDAMNGRCKSGCAPGWVGSGCQKKCDIGKYGSGCSQTCEKCDRDDCDPETGVCRSGCVKGYSGLYCNKKCDIGKYGSGCSQTCEKCDRDDCDPETGVCRSGCVKGYSGLYCNKSCEVGRFGKDCAFLCGNCKHGNPCNVLTGVCMGCADGYDTRDIMCQTKCDIGKYGSGCSQTCEKCDRDDCDPETGVCRSGCVKGYSGLYCNKKCDIGKYGSGCSQTCEKCDRDDCDPETGVCRSGCVKGYSGLYCNKSCEVGRFGKDCAFLCGNCKHGNPCNVLTGVCMGCADGYDTRDIMCQTKCIDGKFGAHCSKRCGNCKDGESCHHAKGTCENSCKAGYHGDGCSQQCDDYFYGEGCTHACGNCENNSTCDRASGFCLNGCLDGYSGTRCHMEVLQEETEWWIIAVAVVSSVGVLLVVACIVTVCIRRFKSRSVPLKHGRAEDAARNGQAFEPVGVERRITSASSDDSDDNEEIGNVPSTGDPATAHDGYLI